MQKQPKYVAMVDGYSTGAALARELKQRGVKLVHVRSQPQIPKVFLASFEPELYEEDFQVPDLAQLAAYPLVAVLAGTETGVELADALSERLGLPSNGTASSRCRRDKFAMIERLRARGIPAARQALVERAEQLASLELGFPLVLKPLDSAGTDGVHVCRNVKELLSAFQGVKGIRNRMGLINRAVVVQEFLEGTEYFVDTVSRDGRHLVTDIAVYAKVRANGRDRIYDSLKLLPFDSPLARQLTEYFFRVLDAMEIQHGPAHGEIILTAQGPRLVEIGARLAGIGWPLLAGRATGYSQVQATVDAYLAPETFFEKFQSGLRKDGDAWLVLAIARGRGQLERGFRISLPALVSQHWTTGPIVPTVDLFTSPGYVGLFGHRPAELEQAYRLFRQLEQGLCNEKLTNCRWASSL